jgi:hypothetical protein
MDIRKIIWIASSVLVSVGLLLPYLPVPELNRSGRWKLALLREEYRAVEAQSDGAPWCCSPLRTQQRARNDAIHRLGGHIDCEDCEDECEWKTYRGRWIVFVSRLLE